MNTVSTITPDWQEWIIQNLRLGCTSETIVETMVLNNYDAMFAKAVVQVIQNEQSQSFINENPRFSHLGNYIETLDRKVRIISRMDRPCIAILDNLLSIDECEELINNSLLKLQRSTTIDPILNYKIGAEYKPHFDYFSENETGSQPHLEKGGQRISTLVVYLNDVETGGEQFFLR